EHVMRDAKPLGHVAGIVDILPGAAGALAVGGRTVVVKLQRNADDVITLGLQQRSRDRGVDPAGHGDDDPCVLWTALEIQTVEHGSGIAAIAAAPRASRSGNFRAVPEKRDRLIGTA